MPRSGIAGSYDSCIFSFLRKMLFFFFSHLSNCIGDPQLVSGFLSRRIALFIDVEILYPWEEVSLGSYIAILYWNPY